jgi:hypothetical protein
MTHAYEESELAAAIFFKDKVVPAMKKLAEELSNDPDFIKIRDLPAASIPEMLESAAEEIYLGQFLPPSPE